MLNLAEQKFGRLTAVKPVGRKCTYVLWECRCDCGNIVQVMSGNLRRTKGGTRSCGCLVTEHCHNKLTPRNRKAPGEASLNWLIDVYKTSARSRGYEFSLTREEFIALTQQDCHYCGTPPSRVKRVKSGNGSFTYNGIDRVDNSEGYTVANSVPCCKTCNRAKDTMSAGDFYAWINRVHAHILSNS